MPKLNLKNLPKVIGEKEDGVVLKQPQQSITREDDYRKRRLNHYFVSKKRCFLPRKHNPDVIVRT
jgi:hypothetical protein